MDGSLDAAQTGQAVTIVLTDEIDVSRGDVLCGVGRPAKTSDQFQANIIWMAKKPLLPGRDYFLKATCKTLSVTITAIRHKINIQNFSRSAAKTLGCNELGVCNISLNQSIVFDPFKEIAPMGRFVIIDKHTSETVGAGMINFSLRRASNLTWQNLEVNKAQRSIQKHQRPIVLWFTGLSGAGKSTIASLVEKKLFDLGRHTYTLDGDNVRHGLNKDLGFTDADRVENIRRIAETARLMTDAGLIVLVSFISPFRAEREMARQLMGEDSFVEIYINTPLGIVEARDVKGLYAKARRGEIKNFTGIDSEYQEPANADIVVDTTRQDAQQATMKIIDYLKTTGIFEG
jgi:bifunctional enzyme CysN/CysC